MGDRIENKQFNGRKGKIWVNDKRYTNCFNMTTSININYEEIPNPNGFGMVQVPNGYTGEITLTIRRDGTEQELINEIAEAASKNLVPDLAVIGSMTRNDEKEANRYRYDGVTFDAVELQKFEQDSAVTELELSGKFVSFEEI